MFPLVICHHDDDEFEIPVDKNETITVQRKILDNIVTTPILQRIAGAYSSNICYIIAKLLPKCKTQKWMN